MLLFVSDKAFANENLTRVDKLTKNLRCLICQGQSIYDSQSEFALSVKELINEKIDKYTLLLWSLPLILFIFGGLLIFRKVFIKLNKIN